MSDEINRIEHEGLLERDAELAAIDRLLADAAVERGAVASLRFLHFFGRRLNDARGALILARRVAQPSPATQLLGELAAERGVRLIQPAPLSESAVSELVRQSCSQDAASEFCSRDDLRA